MPPRHRHCACLHVPEPAALRVLLAEASLSEAQTNRVVSLLHARLAGDRRHDGALRHISLPDDFGHIHWIGSKPLVGGARVQYRGQRISAAQWLWMRAGRPDVPITRTCHDTECIAPGHHALVRDDGHSIRAKHAALEEFDRTHPRINPRPKRWDKSNPTGERCMRGHPLQVYDVARRYTYCAECAALESVRRAERAKIEQRIEWQATGRGRLHTYAEERAALEEEPAVPEWEGKTLVEMLEAENADVG